MKMVCSFGEAGWANRPGPRCTGHGGPWFLGQAASRARYGELGENDENRDQDDEDPE
jgi:hypothetical protein